MKCRSMSLGNSRFGRPFVFFVLFVSLVAVAGQAQPTSRIEQSAFAPVLDGRPAGDGPIQLANVPLLGASKTLELEQFDVWAPDAKIHVQTGDRVTIMAPPNVRYYRGTVAGD